ncbi:MAG: hypothetical protein IKV86_07150 [Clostridia bacterium]|nr:hypothetical protein [Clostridia bacterium]
MKKFIFYVIFICVIAAIVFGVRYISSCVSGKECARCGEYIVGDYYYNKTSSGETIYYCERCGR